MKLKCVFKGHSTWKNMYHSLISVGKHSGSTKHVMSVLNCIELYNKVSIYKFVKKNILWITFDSPLQEIEKFTIYKNVKKNHHDCTLFFKERRLCAKCVKFT